MTRYRRKKALYEVISKTKPRPDRGRAAERLRPETAGKDEPATEKSAVSVPGWVSQWRRKPRIVQFNAGRIELSMPYQLAIALLLGIVLLILIAFRVGEYSARSKQELAPQGPETTRSGEGTTPSPMKKKPDATGTLKQPGVPAKTHGDHRIVIQQFHKSRDLEHVQRYFFAHGIETVIERRGSQYFLLTKDTYENPKKAGTNGAAALKKIKQIGTTYKAPQGYESFARRLFSDAYGEKIKK
jgi:hypothetical protein